MYTCSICGAISHYNQCDDCFARYQEDIRTGHTPPQFIEADVPFEYLDWRDIKGVEQSCARKRLTREETIKAVDLMILRRVGVHKATPKTQAQIRQEADARIKKYSVY